MKTIIPLLAALLFGLSACSSTSVTNSADTAEEVSTVLVKRIQAEEFLAEQQENSIVLDVRTQEEFGQAHLAGAVNIDVRAADFKERVGKLDPDQTYYLYCRSGNRSGIAGDIMREMGFSTLYNIGGLADLEQAGASVVKN